MTDAGIWLCRCGLMLLSCGRLLPNSPFHPAPTANLLIAASLCEQHEAYLSAPVAPPALSSIGEQHEGWTPCCLTHARTHTDTQTHRHTDAQTHRHTDTQTHTHTNTHTHAHTHTRARAPTRTDVKRTQSRLWNNLGRLNML